MPLAQLPLVANASSTVNSELEGMQSPPAPLPLLLLAGGCHQIMEGIIVQEGLLDAEPGLGVGLGKGPGKRIRAGLLV